jgi:hypothetical protein
MYLFIKDEADSWKFGAGVEKKGRETPFSIENRHDICLFFLAFYDRILLFF